MSIIEKIINSKKSKMIYLNSPEFLLDLKNTKRNRKKNTKISQKNIEAVTECLNCIAADPRMDKFQKSLLNEQIDHFKS